MNKPLKLTPASESHLLRELLAVMHGDGGHYVQEHGISKAVADAIELWYTAVAANEKVEDTRTLANEFVLGMMDKVAPQVQYVQAVARLLKWKGPKHQKPHAGFCARTFTEFGIQADNTSSLWEEGAPLYSRPPTMVPVACAHKDTLAGMKERNGGYMDPSGMWPLSKAKYENDYVVLYTEQPPES